MARVLIIADVHANLAALEAVLTAAGTVEDVWNLGDTVGYGPDPTGVCERIASLEPAVWLAGNHDLAATGDLPLDQFNFAAAAAAHWSREQLSEEWQNLFRQLPTVTHQEGVTFAHGSVRDPIWEYVLTTESAEACLRMSPASLVLVGHSHVALTATLVEPQGRVTLSLAPAGGGVDLSTGRWLVNPGSVGQPRDGDPRAAFALLDRPSAHLVFQRVPYDVARTQRAMRAAGLPKLLIDRLELGR